MNTPLNNIDNSIDEILNIIQPDIRFGNLIIKPETYLKAHQQLKTLFKEMMLELLPEKRIEQEVVDNSKQGQHDSAIWNYGVRAYNQAIDDFNKAVSDLLGTQGEQNE